jgi:class 3 adenylate cyclase
VFAKRVWSPDYPWAPTPDERAVEIAQLEKEWGTNADVEHYAPSTAGDESFRRRLATYFRRSATPSDAAALYRMNTQIDIRSVLPTIRVPTLCIHRVGDRDIHVEEGRWLAAQIPQARFLELPGEDHFPWTGDADRLLDEVEEFFTGHRPAPRYDTVLATVLFTDIVASTERARREGDARWSDLLALHDAAVRRELEVFYGREVNTTGDGFLAVFDGPGRAIRAAWAISDAVQSLGIQIRAGVHTGECTVRDGRVEGITVHIGARIAALAGAGEVFTSATVRDLTPGARISFEPRGEQELKGVAGRWAIFAASPLDWR